MSPRLHPASGAFVVFVRTFPSVYSPSINLCRYDCSRFIERIVMLGASRLRRKLEFRQRKATLCRLSFGYAESWQFSIHDEECYRFHVRDKAPATKNLYTPFIDQQVRPIGQYISCNPPHDPIWCSQQNNSSAVACSWTFISSHILVGAWFYSVVWNILPHFSLTQSILDPHSSEVPTPIPLRLGLRALCEESAAPFL